MTAKNQKAVYACINLGGDICAEGDRKPVNLYQWGYQRYIAAMEQKRTVVILISV